MSVTSAGTHRSPEPSRPTDSEAQEPDLSGVRDESAEAAPWRMELPWLGRAVFVISIVICLAHLYFNTVSTLSELWVSALHYGLFGLLCALTIGSTHSRIPGRELQCLQRVSWQ